jgi:hypothetical protein
MDRMRRRLRRTEWLLLIAPCFFLLGFGYFLHAKREERFALVTRKVFLAPVTPQQRQLGYDTQVTIVMDTRGSWPAWLTAPTPPQGPLVGGHTDLRVYYMKNGKKYDSTGLKGSEALPQLALVILPLLRMLPSNTLSHTAIELISCAKELGQIDCDIQADLAYVSPPPSAPGMSFHQQKVP